MEIIEQEQEANHVEHEPVVRAQSIALEANSSLQPGLEPNASFSQQVLENMTTAIVVIDQSCSILFVNPAAENLLACSKARLLGHPLTELFDLGEAFSNQLIHALENQQSLTHRDFIITLPTKESLTLDCTVTPHLSNDLPPTAIVELIEKDRFWRINRDQTLISNHQATRLLLKGLAHEVKNPLGGILGAAQLMKRELQNDQYSDYLNIIIEETDRLKNLVDRMLGPRNLPVFSDHNIHEILERVLTILQAEGIGRMGLFRDYDVSLPEVEVDRDRLIQALLNIMRNAVQALNEDHEIPAPMLKIKTRVLRQYTLSQKRHRLALCIQIIDNGPGIPDSLLESIFLPMVSSRAEGNGLGLSIAQDIVNQHDGLLECSSKTGRTCFTLVLPLRQMNK